MIIDILAQVPINAKNLTAIKSTRKRKKKVAPLSQEMYVYETRIIYIFGQ